LFALIRPAALTDWAQDPDGNQQRIAQTFAEACDVAENFGERLAAEGEICWGGMHSWKKMIRFARESESTPHPRIPSGYGPYSSLYLSVITPRKMLYCPLIGIGRIRFAWMRR
jgi:hypothetical protein